MVQNAGQNIVYDFNCFDQTWAAGNNVPFVNKFNVESSISSKQFNSYKIGAWNANGWKSITHPENVIFKENVLKSMDLDIYLLTETHFLKDDIFSINGFRI